MFRALFQLAGVFVVVSSVTLNAQNLLDGPEGISFDSVNNRYLVSCYWGNNVIQIDPDGSQSYFRTGVTQCRGNCIVGNVLYVSVGWTNIVGYDLTTTEPVMDLPIAGATRIKGMIADTSGYLYAVDSYFSIESKIYRIDVSEQTYTVLADTGLTYFSADLAFDARHNRLLICSYASDTPIKAFYLNDSSITTLVATSPGIYNGIAIDDKSNVYLSSNYDGGQIYRYDSTFSIPPEVFTSEFVEPECLRYNVRDKILAVPDFSLHTVTLMNMAAMIKSDTTWGQSPLEVNFTCWSNYDVEDWKWSFGDGDSAFVQSPTHIYQSPGIFDVAVEVSLDEETYTDFRENYIAVLADSLIAPEVRGDPGATVEVNIYAHNTQPVDRFSIPVEYLGLLAVTLDSFSTVGCRTEYFDNLVQSHSDPVQWQARFLVYNDPSGSTPDLEPGAGPVLRLYFTIPSSAVFGRTSTISLDGYSSYIPEFEGPVFDYRPVCIDGSVSLTGTCGDADASGGVNILDVTYIINYLYKDGPPPDPEQLADADGSGNINLLDVTHLINYLYKYGPNPIC